MGLRHVWNKYPTKYVEVQTTYGSGRDVCYVGVYVNETRNVYIFTCDDYSFDPKTGEYSIVGDYNCAGVYTEADGLSPSSISIATGKYFFWATGSSESNATRNLGEMFKANAALSLKVKENSQGYDYMYATASHTKYTYERGCDESSFVQVSSSSSSKYPSNSYSGNYWYILQGSDTVDPISVNIPDAAKGIEGLLVTIAPSEAKVYEGAISYRYFVSTDGQVSWTQVEETTETETVLSVPEGAALVAIRVQALDDMGFVSTDYVVAANETSVTWNAAPAVSGEDADLGTLSVDPPAAITYTVSDVDGGVVTVTIALDGVELQSGEIVLDAENRYTISAADWLKILNGTHEIVITAEDEYGATAVRTYTFTKDVTELSVTLSEPWITDGMVTRMYILSVWSVPEGAAVQVLATNNALDAEPVWQDVTEAVKLGKKFYFENATKTAADWAVNFKVLADRGTADKVYIKKLTGAFDGLGGA